MKLDLSKLTQKEIDDLNRVAKFNRENRGYPIYIYRRRCTILGYPVIIPMYTVRGDDNKEVFNSFEDAVEHREKILQKSYRNT